MMLASRPTLALLAWLSVSGGATLQIGPDAATPQKSVESQMSVTHGACPACATNATQYAYDGLGRVQSITDAAGGVAGLTTAINWYPGGQRLSSMTGGGVTEEHCYDARGRVTTVAAGTMAAGACPSTAGDGVSQLFEYVYDNRGNRTQEYYATPTTSETTTYGYDQEDRLTGTLDQAQVATLYSVNGSGSRLGQAVVPWYPAGAPLDQTAYGGTNAVGAELNLQYHLDTTERLVSNSPAIVDAVSNTTLGLVTTDSAGRVTQYLDGLNPQNSRQYDWDAANRLVRAVTINGGNLATPVPLIPRQCQPELRYVRLRSGLGADQGGDGDWALGVNGHLYLVTGRDYRAAAGHDADSVHPVRALCGRHRWPAGDP